MLKDIKGPVQLKDLDAVTLREIQQRLNIPADGIYGPQTLTAFNKFKVEKFLGQPGVLGPSTAQALLKVPSRKEHISAATAKAVYGRALSVKQLADLNRCCETFDITTPNRIRHFLAQTGHESAGLRWMKELADGRAYNGRRDLGNIYPGDGPKFKGAGPLQVTGRHNYTLVEKAVNDPLVTKLGVDYVANTYPFTAAGIWWRENGINAMVDRGATVRQVSARVNGKDPANGLSDRIAYYNRAVAYVK